MISTVFCLVSHLNLNLKGGGNKETIEKKRGKAKGPAVEVGKGGASSIGAILAIDGEADAAQGRKKRRKFGHARPEVVGSSRPVPKF